VDGSAGDIGEHGVQVLARSIQSNSKLLGEPPDGLACYIVSVGMLVGIIP